MIRKILAKRWIKRLPDILNDDEYLRVKFDSGRVYLDVVDEKTSMEEGRPIKGFYSNVAFFHRKFADELEINVVAENIEKEAETHSVSGPSDAHRTLEASDFSDAQTLEDVAEVPIDADQRSIRWFTTDYVEKAIMDAPVEALTVKEVGRLGKLEKLPWPWIIGGFLTLLVIITGVYAVIGGGV